jgi:histidyl-tRNA synthetase
MGLERLLTMMPEPPARRGPRIFLAPLGQLGAERALLLARELRAFGVSVELDGRGGRLKGMLRRADALGARLCIILGDAEVERGVLAVKDLVGHLQEEIPIDGAARVLADRVAGLSLGAPSSQPRGTR